MKKTIFFMLSGLVFIAFAPASSAGVYDQNCQMCHRIDDEEEGVAKASKDDLLSKFKTKGEFVTGAQAATDTDMESIQNDKKLLEDAAADMGLK